MNKIPNDWLLNSVEHKFGGNGWAVVQVLDDDNVRLINAHKINPVSQIFLAWNKCIKLEKLREKNPATGTWITTDKNVPINDDLIPDLKAIRAKLASGDYVVKNTRLVKAEPDALLI